MQGELIIRYNKFGKWPGVSGSIFRKPGMVIKAVIASAAKQSIVQQKEWIASLRSQ
ncbi:hypothetical protein SAMN05444169_3555 [Bradyrhizobium erythrophlei]|uniref:Uncharacterized protein n=1 Tax=Bradyrhizobium erythrophlei TaxID=1437360 RepID=A0A1M5LM81_9BRAD|nr:hypothetical protein SAMN05444169_3555 [Bradyrhizobium erythrophlei]